MEITKAQKRAYLNEPWRCPFCQSDNIQAEPFEDSRQEIWCHECDRKWYDVYKLVDIEFIQGSPIASKTIPLYGPNYP